LQILHEEIPRRLKIAKSHDGELRENREYMDIEREKELLEVEVRKLETLLSDAQIIDEESISTDVVGLGTRVILEADALPGKKTTLELVSHAEVDLEHGRISTESPLGELLLGQKKGSKVKLKRDSGTITYKIVGIQRAD
jgi:transcription elongation factor GreA